MTLMVLLPTAMVRHSVPAVWHCCIKYSLLFIKPTGRGELVFKEFVLEVVNSGFWWTSGSTGIFKERSISLEDYALLFLAS